MNVDSLLEISFDIDRFSEVGITGIVISEYGTLKGIKCVSKKRKHSAYNIGTDFTGI